MPDKERPDRLIPLHIAGLEQAINDLCAHWYLGHGLAERSATEAHFRVEEGAAAAYIPHLLLSYGRSIRIIAPAFLKDKLVELTGQLGEYYRSM
ncbi:hypothetical protein SK3146_04368 [Paenibacillus konkukensis]|uniref:WYL domain-containing protein n=1 Tax=Paenibacillus konkukensis TaxID=2020716 RepID=A0ABY4RSS3_9BACL|nr:hypothetical protein SK3146_04368 [Paenibacillus konkukensis]